MRLRADGRSHLRGSPAWLEEATALDLFLNTAYNGASIQTSNSTTRLTVEAPPLMLAAPEAFAQLKLFENTLTPQDTAVALLEESMRAAVAGDNQSDTLDRGVLGAITQFQNVLEMGFSSISLNGGAAPPVEITQSRLDAVKNLVITAPEPRKVIMSGKLDTLTNSRRVFILKPQSGGTIRGFYPQSFSGSIASLYGRTVIVDGEATYRPSGAISSIIASSLRVAGDDDAIWSSAPKAPPRSIDDLAPRRPVAAGGSPYAQIFGAWPGEESDEEVEKMLANLG